jgi:hypothetical protein
MKKLLFALVSFISLTAFAQNQPSPAAVTSQKVGDLSVMIKYYQPAVKGRLIFGTKDQKALVPFGEVWRTGANEATTIELSRDAQIQGKTLAKGTYSVFTIPGPTEWTVIFNKVAKQWGAYSYKAADDVLRVTGKVSEVAPTERFTINLSASGQLSFVWDKTSVSVYIK